MSDAAESSSSAKIPAQILERLRRRSGAFERYSESSEIDRGGQGAILRVWDEDLHRHLAMKVLRAETADDEPANESRASARFLEEARVTSQLDHPGIVPVHELGLDSAGRLYFTMKLVKGRTFERILGLVARGEEGWTRTRALSVLLKVCEAMAYAHDKGVVHRDLKPSNVMVGRYGEVFVMDWGLAKVLEPARTKAASGVDSVDLGSIRRDLSRALPDSPLVTMAGDVMGTPAYMAPEQALGRVEEIGPHTDVYAVGAMLYHLLAGHVPYATPGEALTYHALWERVRHGPPPPLHEVAADAPAELCAICDKAMARDASARYADMGELAADLAAFLEHRVVSAYASGAFPELRKWIQRNPALAAALGAAFSAVSIGLVASLVLKARSDENAAEARARHDEVLRLSALQDVDDLLAEADGLWPAHAENSTRYDSWMDRASSLLADLPVHRAKRAELLEHASAGAPAPKEDRQARWWANQLGKLIGELEGLADERTGLLSQAGTSPEHGWSIPKRRALAEELRAGFEPGGAFARAWDEALPELRSGYPGLDLAPQVGLVPLGTDPDSGLSEFAHVQTGEVPVRDVEGRLVLTEETCLVFVLLPGGTFSMGAQSRDRSLPNFDPQADVTEGPVHEVTLSPFFLSKYEMTQAQWLRATGANPSYHQHSRLASSLLHPVEQVSWEDCARTLARLGLALPSEAQWEYGARAGTTTRWWTGEERESLFGAANLADQSAKRAGAQWADIGDWPDLDDGFAVHAPVGEYAPNPFGLHNVHGNVWEWCLDGFQNGYSLENAPDPVFPPADSASRVLRGCGFDLAALHARSAARDDAPPTLADSDVGIRPARAIVR